MFDFSFFSDVFQTGIWAERSHLKSEKLRSLAESLPSLVLSSKATSTTVKYKNAWLCWKRWERLHVGSNHFPVSPLLLSLYLRDKVETCQSSAPIEAAVYGVRWAHELAGVPSPTDHSLVKQVLEACKRLLGKPVEGKRSLDIDIINQVAQKFNVPHASVSQLRICFLFVVAFAGLMRCDEILQVTREDVKLFPDHMTIFCAKRKNDQLSRGHTIYFARSGKITCPVCITEQLLAQLPKVPKQHLVCRLASNGQAFQPALSYSRVRELFRETLSLFDSNWRDYGTHSLKKGGASVSSAAGMSGELLDKHAGWKCAQI